MLRPTRLAALSTACSAVQRRGPPVCWLAAFGGCNPLWGWALGPPSASTSVSSSLNEHQCRCREFSLILPRSWRFASWGGPGVTSLAVSQMTLLAEWSSGACFLAGLTLCPSLTLLISCVSCRIGSKKNDPCQYWPAEPDLAKFPRSREFLIPNGSQNAVQKQKEFPNWGSNWGCADAYPRRKLLTPSNTGINITTSFINSSPAGHMTRSDSDSMSDRWCQGVWIPVSRQKMLAARAI